MTVDLSGLHGSPSALYLVGDVHKRLADLPDNSVDLIMTSPPFLTLRSYLPADHPDKGAEMGSEPTPAAFIDGLLDVVEELRRVLAPHGSICIELGDTFSGSGGAGGDYNEGGLRDGQAKFSGSAAKRAALGVGDEYRPSRAGRLDGYPQSKSLCLIPESFRWALAYGRNPFNGRTTPTWKVRNVIRWCRPNPPVGALGDKFRPATSEMVIACTTTDRYFDLDAVRVMNHPERVAEGSSPYKSRIGASPKGVGTDSDPDYRPNREDRQWNPAGAPPLDWWEIPTHGYPGSHYATFPPALCVRPILAMCPQRVCLTCGQPNRRIVDVERLTEKDDRRLKDTGRLNGHDHPPEVGWEMQHTTLGWTDCGHGSFRSGIVLDPFAGSGTTLAVATGHGRSAVGIDLDSRNADLARDRVGMFLAVEGDRAVDTINVGGKL